MSDENKESTETRRGRGFAAMDRDKQQKIARKGGIEAHRRGTAHEFSSDEARAAGHKGGLSVSQNRSHMAAIGRSGGQVRGRNLRARASLAAQSLGNRPTGGGLRPGV